MHRFRPGGADQGESGLRDELGGRTDMHGVPVRQSDGGSGARGGRRPHVRLRLPAEERSRAFSHPQARRRPEQVVSKKN